MLIRSSDRSTLKCPFPHVPTTNSRVLRSYFSSKTSAKLHHYPTEDASVELRM